MNVQQAFKAEQAEFEDAIHNKMRLNTAYFGADIRRAAFPEMHKERFNRKISWAVKNGKIKMIEYNRFIFYYRGIPVIREMVFT